MSQSPPLRPSRKISPRSFIGWAAIALLAWSCNHSGHEVSSAPTTSDGNGNSVSTDGPVHGGATQTFSELYNGNFQHSCQNCHVPGGSATVNNGTTLDFTDLGTAYGTLTTGVSSGNNTPACNGIKLVDTSNWQNSYLLAILSSQYAGGGNFVNAGCTPYAGHYENNYLSADELASVVNWIQTGAPNN